MIGDVQHAVADTSGATPAARGAERDIFAKVWPLIPELRGYLRKRLPPCEVDDVVQDIFLRLFRRGELNNVEHPRRYLFQVAQATLIDRHRQARSRCLPMHCELSGANHPHDELSPDRILLGREDVRAAQTVLAGLPERTREILIAVRLEGCSLKIAAARHGISTSAVEKHLSRALRALSLNRLSSSAHLAPCSQA